MKIGFIFKPDNPNIAYRVVAPAEALQRRGHAVSFAVQRDDSSFPAELLTGCDVVHVYRRADRSIQRWIDPVRRRGVGFTWGRR